MICELFIAVEFVTKGCRRLIGDAFEDPYKIAVARKAARLGGLADAHTIFQKQLRLRYPHVGNIFYNSGVKHESEVAHKCRTADEEFACKLFKCQLLGKVQSRPRRGIG